MTRKGEPERSGWVICSPFLSQMGNSRGRSRGSPLQNLGPTVLAPCADLCPEASSCLSCKASSCTGFSHLLYPSLTSAPEKQASSSKRTAPVSAVKKAGQTAGALLSPAQANDKVHYFQHCHHFLMEAQLPGFLFHLRFPLCAFSRPVLYMKLTY